MRPALNELVGKYKNNLYAVAFNILKNPDDAEDAVQDTFVQYFSNRKEFETEEHVKAWLIRVAINKAKNINASFWRKNKVTLDETQGEYKISYTGTDGAPVEISGGGITIDINGNEKPVNE